MLEFFATVWLAGKALAAILGFLGVCIYAWLILREKRNGN